ncbi:hypothetical protein [Natranaeroarchaeum sulfidigenes]|uniref:Uncharacterized protein n=1 Tax=Natranaeroarchaeum sulfidigenes TaxID=2784880 RepID=A0A897MTF3_9EURY|nr:hypothetical protein [Natranaeroarchaeum sulfidigenes]QSG03767.1 Uncharacterized protein AArcS_2571 [Natranaeroarchaeum sulfidigenes]
MRRRTLLATVGTTAIPLTGCVDRPADRPTDGDGSSDTTTVRGAFDDTPVRPECEYESETVTVEEGDETHEYSTAEPVAYPDPPGGFKDDEVIAYAEAFEEAYTSHDAICDSTDHILNVSYSTMEDAVEERQDGITTVTLLRVAGASKGVGDEGPPWATELVPEAVGYTVDETGVARVEAEEPVAPDELGNVALEPLRDGELVATFE